MHHPTDRITATTVNVTPVVELTMKDRSDDPQDQERVRKVVELYNDIFGVVFRDHRQKFNLFLFILIFS